MVKNYIVEIFLTVLGVSKIEFQCVFGDSFFLDHWILNLISRPLDPHKKKIVDFLYMLIELRDMVFGTPVIPNNICVQPLFSIVVVLNCAF